MVFMWHALLPMTVKTAIVMIHLRKYEIRNKPVILIQFLLMSHVTLKFDLT